jgi:hypothetical protein
MKAFPTIGAHPHQVAIPRADTPGVRSYREAAEPHPLQLTFLEEAGEQAWVEEVRALLSAGQADAAERRLRAELAGFSGQLAALCQATRSEAVEIDGWADLDAILQEWEGPPVTAITLGLTNPPDLVFEAGRAHEPELLLGLYSDEGYSFSAASQDALLAECSKELPAWVGHEEDVEFYCAASGLADLNTALIGHKHRHFLRDGRDGVEGRAPGGYVEYVLGCWLRSTLFLQALQRAAVGSATASGCRIVAGAVGVNADFVTVIGPSRKARRKRVAPVAEPQFAPLTIKAWVPKEDPAAVPASGSTLRQRIAPMDPPASAPAFERASTKTTQQPRANWLARLFKRFRGGGRS